MRIFAIETVTRLGSLAFWENGECAAMVGETTRTHGERLPGEAIEWLAANGRTLADIDLFAVVTGPGSFTGLRVGIAAVQGLSLASHRPVIGLPTLDAMVAGWRESHDQPGLVVPCLDGQRGDVFYAALDVLSSGVDLDDCPRLVAPAVGRPDAAADAIRAAARGRRVVIIGDGAVRHADILRAAVPDADVLPAPRPLAEGAARLAARHPERAGAPHALQPFYLRQTDAELARARRTRVAGAGQIDLARCAIRRATGAEDVQAVQTLQQATFTNAWGAEAIQWELENTDVARLYVMVSDRGELLAYCACWIVFDELHINSFAVDPAWRRQGIARHFLRAVLAEGVTAGARSATLEVRASNVPARRLYEGFGFRVEGTRRDYYQEPREDALILWHRSIG